MGKKKRGDSDIYYALKALTVFDWISPIVNTAHDMATGQTFNYYIEVRDVQMRDAAKKLRKHGIKTGSQDTYAFSKYGMLTLANDADYDNAIFILKKYGFDLK